MRELTDSQNLQNNIKDIVSEKEFRIHTKYLFLTYARCPESWTMEFMRNKLVDEILVNRNGDKKYFTKVKSYIIAEESHKESVGKGEYNRGNRHYHCLIELNERLDIRKKDYLDIEGIHGNYQVVREIFSVLNYVKKHGKYIGEGFPGMQSRERAILDAATDQDAKLMLMEKMNPESKMKLRREIISTETKKTVIREIADGSPDYPYQKVLEPYEIFKGRAGFNTKGRPMGLLIYGQAESGKTTGTYKMAAALGLEVSVIDDLREMKDHYKDEEIILLDEMKKDSFEKYSSEIANFVTNPTAKTTSYYGSKELVWPRKIVIATNEDISSWNWTEGLKSRFLMIKAKSNGEYRYQMWEGDKLENMSDEQVKQKLGIIKII